VNIDLELYRIFYIVAKYESISKAMKELYISQPAITQRINNLEKQLNIKLFYRKPGGLRLTNEGKELYNYVKDSIETMNSVENKMNHYIKRNSERCINIKSTNLIDNSFLCDTLIKFSQENPKFSINLEIGTEEEAIEELLNGQVDIITMTNKQKMQSKALEIVATKTLNPCLYTSRKYIEKQRTQINIYKKANQYDFILPKKESLERIEFDKFCNKYHLKIQSKYETENSNIRNYFVLNGLGISLGFREYIQEELEKKIFIEIPLKEKLSQCNINWVTIKNQTKEEVAKLIEIAKVV